MQLFSIKVLVYPDRVEINGTIPPQVLRQGEEPDPETGLVLPSPSLIYTPPSPHKIKDAKWEFKRDEVPLLKILPPSPRLYRGEGGYRGMGLEQ